ncbi:hypothetical protein BJV78DRAFT_1184357 [Lactifluus subvellereus]|nr:hypothetical protein BJV78DRAFT_1184357 [Lactifluus subvellereus]
MACAGPWSLSVEVRKNGTHARVLECSLDDNGDVASGTVIFFLVINVLFMVARLASWG